MDDTEAYNARQRVDTRQLLQSWLAGQSDARLRSNTETILQALEGMQYGVTEDAVAYQTLHRDMLREIYGITLASPTPTPAAPTISSTSLPGPAGPAPVPTAGGPRAVDPLPPPQTSNLLVLVFRTALRLLRGGTRAESES